LKFKARIEVTLKRNTIDPAAETVRKSLVDLNLPVASLRLAQEYEVTVEAKTKKEAEDYVKLMCTRLLANPVKDEYKYKVEEDGSTVSREPDS
jgi:phosphoribosylformylglycinamidine synthase subunit PurS